MISIESKRILYNQLKDIEALSKSEKLIKEEEFNLLTDIELIKYTFEYRDRQKIYLGKNVKCYIELPDIDLEGNDLSNFEMSCFVPGIIKDGKIEKSKINLKNTNARINMSTIYHNEEQIHEDYYEYITDLTGSNFQGCELYGRSQAEVKKYSSDSRRKYTFLGVDKLDERYVERRKKHELTKEEQKKSDEVYNRLINEFSLYITLERNPKIDLTDYDFSNLPESKRDFILKELNRKRVNIEYTGLVKDRLGAENIYSLSESAKEALEIKDYDFLLKYLKVLPDKDTYVYKLYVCGRLKIEDLEKYNISEESYRTIINKAYRKNPNNIPQKYWKYLEKEFFGERMYSEYKNKKYDIVLKNCEKIDSLAVRNIIFDAIATNKKEFLSSFLNMQSRVASEVLSKVYEEYGMDMIPNKLRTGGFYSQIILVAYDKGNMEFVNQYFDKSSIKAKRRIIDEEVSKGKFELVKKEFSIASNQTKENVIRLEYQKGNKEFLHKNFKFLPTNESKAKLLLEMAEENLDDVNDIFNELSSKVQKSIIKEIVKFENNEIGAKVLDTLNHKSKNRSSGKFLLDAVKTMSDKEIRKLIELGENVNYSFTSKEFAKVPLIKYVLGIKNVNRRNNILYELFRGNVDEKIDVEVKTNKNEIRTLRLDKTHQFLKLVSYKEMMRRFLIEEVKLSEDEISKIETTFQKFNKNLYDIKISDFYLKKIIFDKYNSSDLVFKDKTRILLNSVNSLYARSMFFKDLNIEIDENNFLNTMGLTNIKFAKQYGKFIVNRNEETDEEYSELIRRTLMEKFKMPQNVLEFKTNIYNREDKKMILVEENKVKGDLLRVYEKENEFLFSDSKVLPIEQREMLLDLLYKASNKSEMQIDSKEESAERERVAGEILKRLQDKRLQEPTRIKTVYSEGGALTAVKDNDKEDLKRNSAKVKYLLVDINGLIILEPFGQKNNATFITEKGEDIERRLSEYGRKEALDNGFYKVMHLENPNSGYNYGSDHILKILDMSIENKELLLKILNEVKKTGKKYCNLDTLEAKYSAVSLAKEYGLSKSDVMSVGVVKSEKKKKGDDKGEK